MRLFKCYICKKVIEKKSNHQKYCDKCSKEINRKHVRNWIKNNPNAHKEWKIKNLDRWKQLQKIGQSKYQKKYAKKHNAREYARRTKQRDVKCLNCGSMENLHFHHTNYEKREGITLCKDCHNQIHR